ncbi:trigger factor [Roseospira navarrensis]|uniref:Trigger factor n=1 Tax=Roseospira navarrensis TaxID=140058 RepID=A0A7X1ZFP5_9PROT|nr:trigger factor [Roseospira navarrensis]MQX37700.1 trigger factor [Roseospira navarrensis]
MQVTETLSEELKREYTVVVPADSLNEKTESRLQEVGSQVRIPGFRPGKVPMSLLKKRFGAHVMGEVLEQAAQDAVQSVIKDNELRPALQPKVEISEYEPEGDLNLTVAVELLPEIELPDFSAIAIEREVAEVPEAEVDQSLERLANARRGSEPVAETRPAQSGDILVIDFVGKKDGEPFPGGAAEDYSLELGSNTFIPGFEDALIGVSVGEEKEVAITFPEDYGAEDLAGQAVTFDVTVKELRQPAPLAIDDELAKSFGRESLDDLKQAIRDQIAQEYTRASREKTKRRLLDKLSDQFTQTVPEGLVAVEFDGIWKQLEQARERDQLDDEDKAKSEDELRAEYRAIAERRVRLGLLLARVGEDNKVTVTQEDMNAALGEQVRSFPGQEQAVLSYYRQNPDAMEELRPPIFENKVVDYILELAQVTDRTVSPEELMKPDPDAEKGDDGAAA